MGGGRARSTRYAVAMSAFYSPRRKRNLYRPRDRRPFALSRSKIDLFLECPRCFYIDRRLGAGRPPGFPFNLNNAVDRLLKAEFDAHRTAGTNHPLLETRGVDARPVAREELEDWRDHRKGVRYLHRPTNFLVTGAIDDLWIDSAGRYIVVDFKATSKEGPITALDQDWHSSYKRQIEVYQWLLRRNGYRVSDTGYFLVCNAHADAPALNGRLEFDLTLIPHTGSDDWVEPTLEDIHRCLNDEPIPPPGQGCNHYAYVAEVARVTGKEGPGGAF